MDSWARIVGFVTSAPDAGEALAGLLHEAIPASGAVAGAILEGEQAHCRAAEGFGAADLDRLLAAGGSIAAAHSRRDAWPDMPFWLPGSVDTGGDTAAGAGRFLIAPLRMRGVSIGAMLLLYRGETGPISSPATATAVMINAGLLNAGPAGG